MGKRSREKKEKRIKEESGGREERKTSGEEKILRNIIFAGACFILFTPLIVSGKFFFPFVGPKSLYFMGLTEIIFFSWVFLAIFYPKYRPKFNPILFSLILFLIVLIFSAIYGVDPLYSFWSKFERMTGILMMLHLLAFFLVISSVFKKKDWIKLFLVSIFAGMIVSLIALLSKNPIMRGGATIGNDSFMATYLLFDLFLAIYLIFKTKEGLKIYSFICFLITSLALLLSGARAAKLSFLTGLVLFFLLWLGFRIKGKLKFIGLSLLALLIILTFIFAVSAFKPGSFVRKQIIERVVGETFGGRFIVWQEAWKGFLQRPLLGWGPENFEMSFVKNYNSCFGITRCGADIWYDRAHNFIFDILVSSGFLGMLAYLGIFAAVSAVLWRNYLKKNIDFWLVGIFSVILISYLIQNLTVFDMVSSYMMFFLILGFIAKETSESNDFGSEPEFPILNSDSAGLPLQSSGTADSPAFDFKMQATAVLTAIILISSLFKFVIQPLRSDYYVIKALTVTAPKERLVFYKKALDASPMGRYQLREQFTDNTINFARTQEAQKFSVEDYKAELDFLAEELEKTIKESPLNFRMYLKLGQIYNMYFRVEPQKVSRAEIILRTAINLSPNNQNGYWELAQTKIFQGKYIEALELAEKAVELEPKLEKSHLIVIRVAKIAGNNDLANKKAEEAIKIDPSFEKNIKQILGS